jgi:DNA-binding IclR family transcriptional regulator
MSSQPSQVVWGLVDGIDVLRELAASSEPVSGKSLAERMDMDPVRVNRLLMTLAWMGIAHRDKSRRYTIGPGMHILATLNLGASGLLRRVISHIEPLLEYPYTVAAGVLWRDMVTYLYHRSPGQPLAEGIQQLVRPATHSSIGIALLAQLPDSEIHELYDQRTTPLPGLYADVDALMRAIEDTRVNGYAALRYPTHVSLAMAVGTPPYAAVAISGFNTPDEEKQFCAMLGDIAHNIAHGTAEGESETFNQLERHLQQVAPSVLA